MAETTYENGPLAVQAVKQIARLESEVPLDYARRMTQALSNSVWPSEDAREGANAFAQRAEASVQDEVSTRSKVTCLQLILIQASYPALPLE